MLIVKPSVEKLEEKSIYKKIELAGRICYKSEDKISDDSYRRFISAIVKRGHYSVLEHADILMEVDKWDSVSNFIPQHAKNQFVSLNTTKGTFFVQANVRAWRELLEIYPIKSIIDYYPLFFGDIEVKVGEVKATPVSISPFSQTDLEPYSIKDTFVITTSRDVSHQIVRHRLLSVSQESQRYCNYTRGRFSDVKFIMPQFVEKGDLFKKKKWVAQREIDEMEYIGLIDESAKPEEARSCLPNATATSLVLTGSFWTWAHFVNLRSEIDAQLEIRVIAEEIKKMLLEKYKGSNVLHLLT